MNSSKITRIYPKTNVVMKPQNKIRKTGKQKFMFLKRLLFLFSSLVPAVANKLRGSAEPLLRTEYRRERLQGKSRTESEEILRKILRIRNTVKETISNTGKSEQNADQELCSSKQFQFVTQNMESSHEQWMNSWTCWTSGLALSKTENLHLDNMETLTTTSQRPSQVSSKLLHSAQKKGGLFDNEFAGVDDPAGTTFDLTNNIDVIDLGDDGSTSLDKLGGDVFDILEAFASPNTSSQINDDLYLSSFLDLSQFLLEDSQSAVDKSETSAPCQGPDKVESPVKNALKRKLEEDDVFNVSDDVMETEPSLANIDHDYVSKKPRTISEVEDEELQTPATKQKTSQKYRARREKNNVASKRSREIRKQKFCTMESEAEKLVVENDKLRIKIAELEQLTKEMKATLISKMVGK